MKDAVKEAVNIDGSRDLPAEFNPWRKKLGHTSLNGVLTATAINSGAGSAPSTVEKKVFVVSSSVQVEVLYVKEKSRRDES
ncbi:Protein of unknown function [Gryllus bimaculatus]|nr:Protein of unknown function [Gryllus bimaculatus]